MFTKISNYSSKQRAPNSIVLPCSTSKPMYAVSDRAFVDVSRYCCKGASEPIRPKVMVPARSPTFWYLKENSPLNRLSINFYLQFELHQHIWHHAVLNNIWSPCLSLSRLFLFRRKLFKKMSSKNPLPSNLKFKDDLPNPKSGKFGRCDFVESENICFDKQTCS